MWLTQRPGGAAPGGGTGTGATRAARRESDIVSSALLDSDVMSTALLESFNAETSPHQLLTTSGTGTRLVFCDVPGIVVGARAEHDCNADVEARVRAYVSLTCLFRTCC